MEYVDRLGNQVPPMIQDVISEQRCSFPRQQCPHSHSWNWWFEEHEVEIQHQPWPTQSPDLNISETL
jgi:hypothetical protein